MPKATMGFPMGKRRHIKSKAQSAWRIVKVEVMRISKMLQLFALYSMR
jgi:hypothetical protein